MRRLFVEPRKAGSVILIRNRQTEQDISKQGFEVLMGRRNEQSDFVPGAYVFPGGALAPADVALATSRREFSHSAKELAGAPAKRAAKSASEPGTKPIAQEVNQPASGAPGGIDIRLAAKIAAIRECFEEMGVLLARQADGAFVSFANQAWREKLYDYRQRILAGDEGLFAKMLETETLTPTVASLHFFSHWITPPFFPIRYDAQFFVAPMPPEQEARHDEIELVAHIWLSPAAILARNALGDLVLAYPTLKTIQALADYQDSDELFARLLAQNEH